MRILSVGSRYPPWSMGGYEVVWESAVRALRAAGHPTRVLTTVADPSDLEPGAAPPADVHRELRWYWHDHEFPPVGLRGAAAIERANASVLRRHLREYRPDVVTWWAMGGMSLSLLEQVRRAGVPALGIVGDEWMLYGPEVDRWTRSWRGRSRRAARLAERLVGVPAQVDLDGAARWLFNCRYLLEAVRDADRTVPDAGILQPGIDPERFRQREPGPWRWRLLYCGRLDPRKGVATAVQALAELPPEATLTIHGDGAGGYVSELRSLAERLGAAGRVRFRRSDHDGVAAAYADADAVVFPVRWREPWGLVPLEAMAVGRPVIASRAGGGPAEYLEEGRNCLQFEPGDAAGLANAVRGLASDAELRRGLIEGGHLTAARFTESAFNAGLERELRRLAEGGARNR